LFSHMSVILKSLLQYNCMLTYVVIFDWKALD
jgi:hypothetical protein